MNLAQLIGEQRLEIDILRDALGNAGADIDSPMKAVEAAELHRRLEALQRELAQSGERARIEIDRLVQQLAAATARGNKLSVELMVAKQTIAELERAERRPSLKGLRTDSCAWAICQFLLTQREPVSFADIRAAIPHRDQGPLSAACFELVRCGRALQIGQRGSYRYSINPEVLDAHSNNT